MTRRSIRRAAERKTKKLARKSAQQSVPAGAHEIPALPEIESNNAATTILSAAETNANLASVPSSFTGRSVLLPASEAPQYIQLLQSYVDEYKPVGTQECDLVQTLAETTWRARRALALEMSIFAGGQIEFAAPFAEHKPEIRASLIEAHTYLTYEKQIRGVQLQEARLIRRAEKARAELRFLQHERCQREEREQTPRKETPQRAASNTAIGFEFTNRPQAPATPANPTNKYPALEAA